MSGWNTIQRVKNLEQEIDQMGFKFSKSKHGDFSDLEGALSLIPRDEDALPIYSRDAELFVGSLERLEDWLAGVRWARDYDRMTINKNMDQQRKRKEQDMRNRHLMQTVKDGKLVKGVEK